MGATERIRVARVIARLNIGGPAIHVSALTARLPRERFESRLFAGEVSPGEAEMVDVLEREGVRPYRVPGLGRAIHAHHDVRALWVLVAEFLRFRPHIVHTHTAKGGALGRIAARLCGVPIVVHTFHGHVFEGYFSPMMTELFLTVERGLARVSNAIVTISPRQRADIIERFRVARAHQTRVIPLGFDLQRFDSAPSLRGQLRAELGIHDAPIVSTIGRLTAIKDHALLFRAFQQPSGMPAPPHLCVVGDGELAEPLRELAAELGIADRTHFLGFRSDLERILADTDVVALSSINEGTPVALIEALAVGCSVVSVQVGGVADVLDEGRWGHLVQARTPEALAAGLRRTLQEHGQRSPETREGARRYARAKYGIERLVNDHVLLYEELLVRAGPNATGSTRIERMRARQT
jgi:glycosyltransferase involved in cell wall biosynthesis